MQDQLVKILNDVRYIPEVKRRLISLGSLEMNGCCFSSSGGKMMVKRRNNLIMTVQRRGSLYYLYVSVVKVQKGQLNLVKPTSIKLWHERLGHPEMGSIKELVKRNVISAFEEQDMPPCQDCIRGKAKKLPYTTGKHNSTSPLDYIQSDLWGPASVNSIGGGRYYMSLIDDYSRKIWIYILKEKFEAFEKFKEWCIEVELEKGCKVKCLRTDNGLEFLSKEFDTFCKQRGIKRHMTVPLNPQQNGIAERANRTIVERVRCMLFSSGLGKKLWGKAASTAVHLMNKCPSSSINGDTPDFRWYGKHSSYSELKIFGCKAFAHVKQGKLDPRALMCVMLGYQKRVKGYSLWFIEPGNHKILISRDAIFLENDMPYLHKESTSDGVRIVANESNDFEVESGVDANGTQG